MLANYYKIKVPQEFINKTLQQMQKVQKHFLENVEGCIKYQCSQDIEDETSMYIFVIWVDHELYKKNLDSEYQKKEILINTLSIMLLFCRQNNLSFQK